MIKRKFFKKKHVPLHPQTKKREFIRNMARNQTIDICKGLAIICMVIGHADCPHYLLNFIYMWHMPLFFITAGYFFSKKSLNEEATFVKKRFKGLYLPFVKWTSIVILLNPVFFATGILNEQYGNYPKGVTHPLNFHAMVQAWVDCFTSMGGYDVFLLSAFWFFRALLVGSIGFLVLFKLFNKVPILRDRDERIILCICLLAFSLSLLKYGYRIRFNNINQGGYRELMCMFFMGLGFLFRKYETKFQEYKWVGWLLLIPLLFCAEYWASSLSLNSKLRHVWRLPIVASMGFYFIYTLSNWLSTHTHYFSKFLAYAGEHSITIMIFHIFAFKVVCIAHVLLAGLDWNMIGCHMVVHCPATKQWVWIIYSVVGVGLPLLGKYYLNRMKVKC